MSLMNSFAKLNLRTKLVIGFSTLIGFMAIISATAFYGLSVLNDSAQRIYEKDLLGVAAIRAINRDFNTMGRYLNRVILDMSYGEDEAALKDIAKIHTKKKEMMDEYEVAKSKIIRPELRAKLDHAEQLIEKVMEQVSVIEAAAKAKDKGGAIAAFRTVNSTEFKKLFDEVIVNLKEVSEAKSEDAHKNLEAATASAAHEKMLIGVFLLLAILLSIGVISIVNKSINDPITNLKNALADLAAERLDTEVHNTDYTNEIGQMAKAVAELQVSLQHAAKLAEAERENNRIAGETTKEIGGIIAAAAGGDFTAAVRVEGKEGFFLDISKQVNQLIETSRNAFRAISKNATSLSAASEELSAVSTQMSSNAEETNAQAGSASSLSLIHI